MRLKGDEALPSSSDPARHFPARPGPVPSDLIYCLLSAIATLIMPRPGNGISSAMKKRRQFQCLIAYSPNKNPYTCIFDII
jgi:hypothetical protein